MISIAMLAPGARQLSRTEGAGVQFTLAGQAHLLDGSMHPVFAKLLGPRRLVNELVCNELGRLLGFNVPRGLLVKIRREDYEQYFVTQPLAVTELYAFGTIGVEGQPLAQTFNLRDTSVAQWFFTSQKSWQSIAAFDCWIANCDRHEANILVDAQLQMWLIDHDLALCGEQAVDSLDFTAESINRVVSDHAASIVLRLRHEALEESKSVERMAAVVDVAGAVQDSCANAFVTAKDFDALVLYLENRRAHVANLMSRTLGIPLLT